ncbi:hypothetical protein RRG08_002989 [Elysia crispata]|uniref:Uncharacterized protein n=1 Tax=Elysia crispata TaxID=231223 RepID=A0AAE1B3V2_9GAST|nr:hypothetical protein RRG08_002989 [Elysia crispata]
MSENRQKWTAFIAEIEKTTHHIRTPTKVDSFHRGDGENTQHVREPTKMDSFHRGDKENNTPCQKTDNGGQLSSRR